MAHSYCATHGGVTLHPLQGRKPEIRIAEATVPRAKVLYPRAKKHEEP